MKRRVLYITDTAAIVGGGEISLLNLLRHIDRAVFDVLVLVPGRGDLFDRLVQMGIEVREFDYQSAGNPLNIGQTVRTIRRFADLIRAREIELVHTNSTGGVMFVAALACCLAHARLVSHVRIFDSGYISDLVQGIFSDRLVMISEKLRRKKSFLLFRAKSEVIYNGVDREAFNPGVDAGALRKALGFDDTTVVIGTIGTFVRGKGFEYALDAFAAMAEDVPEARLLMAGRQADADYAGTIRHRITELGLTDRVTFLGEREDIPVVMNALDIFVFPSLIDAFGRVLIEAMACARPVVAFDRAVNREIIRDGQSGFLVRQKDTARLAEQLKRLAGDAALRSRSGAAARSDSEQRFDITTLTRRTEQLYVRLLGDPRAGYVRCAVCDAAACKPFLRCRITAADARIEETELTLCRCRACGLVFVNPRPSSITDPSGRLYAEKYFESGYMRFYSGASAHALQSNEPFELRMQMIEAHAQTGSLLDVGCANGAFLAFARDRGWKVSGVDISDCAVQTAQRTFGLTIRRGTLEEAGFDERSFDAVSAGDILEHTPDPRSFLRAAHRVLKDEGILYLAVPDFDGLHYRLKSLACRFNRRNYFVLPHHLYQFNRRTLTALLEREGFKAVSWQQSESRLQKQDPLKASCMRLVFWVARAVRMQDRLIVIAQKTRGF